MCLSFNHILKSKSIENIGLVLDVPETVYWQFFQRLRTVLQTQNVDIEKQVLFV